MHRRSLHSIAILVSTMALAFAALAGPSDRQPGRTLLAFNSMVGVDAPFLGNTNPIRGLNGDTDPWGIRSGTGTLDTNGHLAIQIKGLVFTDNENPSEIGKNDEAEFRAVVSCMTLHGTGASTTVTESSVTTPGFKATSSGNGAIRTHVDLPDPCLEPVILIVGNQGEWLAVTGFDSSQAQRNNGKNNGGPNNGGGNNNGGTTGGTPAGTTGGTSGGT